MIKSLLAIRMAERKIKIIDVVRATEIDRGTVTRLYYDKLKRMDLDALDKLCILFNCGVEQIIYFESPENVQSGETKR